MRAKAKAAVALTPWSGHGLSGELDLCVLRWVMHLEVDWCDVPDRGVAPAAVVTVLVPRCDALDRAGQSGPDAMVVELRFQGYEEAFGHVPSRTSVIEVFRRPIEFARFETLRF